MNFASEVVEHAPWWTEKDFWLITVPTVALAAVTWHDANKDFKIMNLMLRLLGKKQNQQRGKHEKIDD